MHLVNSLIGLDHSGLECFSKYNKLPTPDWYKVCVFLFNASSSSDFTLHNICRGIPGVVYHILKNHLAFLL